MFCAAVAGGASTHVIRSSPVTGTLRKGAVSEQGASAALRPALIDRLMATASRLRQCEHRHYTVAQQPPLLSPCHSKTISTSARVRHHFQRLILARSVFDLRIDLFAHGQLYITLSCVRRREDSLVLSSEGNEEKSTADVVNPNYYCNE